MAKNSLDVAWSLSELSVFNNGVLHRYAAMPLTKTAISDVECSGNPIRKLASVYPHAAVRAWWECSSRYNCAGAHGCRWHRQIPLRSNTTLSVWKRYRLVHSFLRLLKYLSIGALSYGYPALLMLWVIWTDSQNSVNAFDVYWLPWSLLYRIWYNSDRGSEFTDPMKMEADPETGEISCRIFYCDPMNSNQKSNCERNHELIRYLILKNQTKERYTEEEIRTMMNHLNSYPRKNGTDRLPSISLSRSMARKQRNSWALRKSRPILFN